MKKILIIILLLFTTQLKSQTITWVNYPHYADIKVFFVEHKWQADIVVWYAPSNKRLIYGYRPGVWIESPKYGYPGLKLWKAKYKHQADFKVYVAQRRYEVRVNNNYLNYIKP